MTKTHKILLAIFASCILMFGTIAYGVHHVVTRQGMISIDVVEKSPGGARVKLVVPGAFVNFCLSFVPAAMPYEERERLHHELARYEPLLRAAVEELEKAPDMVFVEVEDGDEHVTIAKRDGHIVIDVETDHEDVRVEMPLTSVRAAWTHVVQPVS